MEYHVILLGDVPPERIAPSEEGRRRWLQMLVDFVEFGGGVGFLTGRSEMEATIVIRAMRFIDDRVYIRAGAGIVADSVPEHEWAETAAKARACIVALQEAANGH